MWPAKPKELPTPALDPLHGPQYKNLCSKGNQLLRSQIYNSFFTYNTFSGTPKEKVGKLETPKLDYLEQLNSQLLMFGIEVQSKLLSNKR